MKRKVKYIAIHCTGAIQTQSVESILRYWKDKLGWKSPGYHRLVSPNGDVSKLLHFDEVSNGVKGFNSKTINICYIGGQHLDNRTEAQKSSLLDCILEAIEYINSDGVKNEIIIQGHRDFPHVNKACPQFNAKEEYNWITT